MPPPPPPPPPPANTTEFSVTLTSIEATQISAAEGGGASADFTLNVDNSTFSGTVNLSDISAEAVSLNIGFAGDSGDEFVALQEDDADTWSIPDGTTFSDEQRASLDAGQVYVLLSTTTNPDGALRGQIIPQGISLVVSQLSQLQSIPPTGSSATAVGFTTLNTSSGAIAARVITNNFSGATIAHVHQALAGLSGGIVVNLSQDVDDTAFWSNVGNEETVGAGVIDSFNNGGLYFNFHSDDFLAGEIRGQIAPAGIEVTFTELNGGSVVVPGMSGVTTDATAVAASTFNSSAAQLTTHINTVDLDTATGITLNQAPAGQNGPSIGDFTQDTTQMSLWSLSNFNLSGGQQTALQNRGLYFTAATAMFPDGEVRGQLISASSMMGNSDAFQVTGVNPEDNSDLASLPSTVTFTFNREVLAASLTANTVSLTASGGDGMFGDADDVNLSGVTASASGNTIVADLSGVGNVEDDVFRIAIADNRVTDSDGLILDGDGDGMVGGVFASTFNVVTPANPNATFSAIQTNVFNARCINCHGDITTNAGLNLQSNTYNNIVSVASAEQPALFRIAPNNPDDSYIIRKLEGGPNITGGRMPLGGPFLSQSMINDIREWVSNGAPNN